jgi:hypothetical protein
MRTLIDFWGGPWAVSGLVIGAVLSGCIAYLVGVSPAERPALAIGPGAVIGTAVGYYVGERLKERQES